MQHFGFNLFPSLFLVFVHSEAEIVPLGKRRRQMGGKLQIFYHSCVFPAFSFNFKATLMMVNKKDKVAQIK